MANRGYGGTTGIKFNYWGDDGKNIVKNTRRGNEAHGAMSGKGYNATRTAPTGPNILSSDKRLGASASTPEKVATKQASNTNMSTVLSARADKQQADYITKSKTGGTWSIKDFAAKMQKWNKMRSY